MRLDHLGNEPGKLQARSIFKNLFNWLSLVDDTAVTMTGMAQAKGVQADMHRGAGAR